MSTDTPVPETHPTVPPMLHFNCEGCCRGAHGEHNYAVAFGLVECDCGCHTPGYVPGPRDGMSRRLSH